MCARNFFNTFARNCLILVRYCYAVSCTKTQIENFVRNLGLLNTCCVMKQSHKIHFCSCFIWEDNKQVLCFVALVKMRATKQWKSKVYDYYWKELLLLLLRRRRRRKCLSWSSADQSSSSSLSRSRMASAAASGCSCWGSDGIAGSFGSSLPMVAFNC